MKTVIMAGGRGTRIASVANDVPKPMINICGKPILEHQIDNLKACGLTDIILVIGYLGEKIKDYFGDGSRLGYVLNISSRIIHWELRVLYSRCPSLQKIFCSFVEM